MTEWQPDDPGLYARTCDCCGRPTRSRERFCDRHQPAPEPWTCDPIPFWVVFTPLRWLPCVRRRWL